MSLQTSEQFRHRLSVRRRVLADPQQGDNWGSGAEEERKRLTVHHALTAVAGEALIAAFVAALLLAGCAWTQQRV